MTLQRQFTLPISTPRAAVDLAGSGKLVVLETPSVMQRAGYVLANPWKNYLLPAEWLKQLIGSSRSPLIAESQVRPGGWRSMELIYANEQPVDLVDKQALRDNPISIASRNRRRIVIGVLTELIAKYEAESRVILLGVGAGPGRHIQEAIEQSKIETSRVAAYLIDRDDDAFAFGQALASRAGISDCVHFIKGDARQIGRVLPQVSPHIVKLVGIVEYLTDPELLDLLRALRRVMAPGGSLVTHGLVDAYKTRRFLSRVFNLKHHRRSAGHVRSILRSAGFRPVDCVNEPMGIYPILTALRE